MYDERSSAAAGVYDAVQDGISKYGHRHQCFSARVLMQKNGKPRDIVFLFISYDGRIFIGFEDECSELMYTTIVHDFRCAFIESCSRWLYRSGIVDIDNVKSHSSRCTERV